MSSVSGLVSLILTREDGSVRNISRADDTLNAFAETKDLDGGTPFHKIVEGLILGLTDYTDQSNLELVIKGRDNRSEALQTLATISVAGEDPIYTVQRIPQKRYYRLRVQDGPVLSSWKLSVIEVLGRIGSKRL